MKIIKWGIIGLGKIADKFAKDLQTVANTQLIAVSSGSLERAEAFAKKFNVPHFYGTHEDIFQADLDVVYVATPHTSHQAITLLCLQNNVGVLCEKPFAMNFRQVEEMVKVSREKNVFLMEAMWTRFLPTTLKTMELIKAGRIGSVKTIKADFGFLTEFLPERRLLNKKLGGGAMLDIGIYPAFLSLLLLGYPQSIQGVSNFGKTGVDETTSFVFKYESATALLNCSIAVYTISDAWIYGDKGYIHIEERFSDSKKVTLCETNQPPADFVFERNTAGYNYEIEEVNQCLREGKAESALMPLSMSIDLIKILDDVRQKAGIVYPDFD